MKLDFGSIVDPARTIMPQGGREGDISTKSLARLSCPRPVYLAAIVRTLGHFLKCRVKFAGLRCARKRSFRFQSTFCAKKCWLTKFVVGDFLLCLDKTVPAVTDGSWRH